jgi:hypothetical protein
MFAMEIAGSTWVFFLDGCQEEYLNCKFHAFNPGKMIERQVKGAFDVHEIFLMRLRRPVGPMNGYNATANRLWRS